MKKMMTTLTLMMVMALTLAACSTAIQDEPTPAAPKTETAMEKETMAEDKDMAEKETMSEDKDMMEKETMSEDKDMMEKETMAEDKDMAEKETMAEDKDMAEKETMAEDKDMAEKESMSEDKDMMKEDETHDKDMADDSMMKNEGNPAPAFDLMSTEGEQISLESLAGEKVYVKFWASWCPICVSGIDKIDDLSAMEGDFKVVTIVSPGFSGEKDTEAFKAWFAEKGTEDMIVLLDEGGTIAQQYRVRAYPTSAFIGSDGVLVGVRPGHLENDQIKGAFEAIH